jgi:hypothetical protein
MAHGQPVLARLQLSHDEGVGGAAAVVVPCQTASGSADPCDVSTVAGTLGSHVGGGASDLEGGRYLPPASGEVGLRTVAMDRTPPDPDGLGGLGSSKEVS